MKRFTLIVVAALIATLSFAQKPVTAGKVLQKAPETIFTDFSGSVSSTKTSSKAKAPKKVDAIEGITELPAGVEGTEFTASGSAYVNGSQTTINKSVTVAFDGSDVYIGGLNPYTTNPTYYVKGTLEGSTVTFPSGYYWGNPGVDVYFVGYSPVGTDVVFKYEEATQTFTLSNYILVNANPGESLGFYAYYQPGLVIAPPTPKPDPVTPPADLVAEEYSAKFLDRSGEAATGSVKVGFDGNDVYFQGLGYYVTDGWVKGSIDGNVVTLPANQYLGEFEGYDEFYNPTAFGAPDAVFNYDEASETFTLTSENGVYTFLLSGASLSYYGAWYDELVLTKVTEVAATPATPSITAFEVGQWGPVANLNIPTVDVDGNGLVTEKLFYQFYTDIEGDVQPLTLDASGFQYLEENISIIPYTFNDNYDIGGGSYIYFNTSSDSWNKIGIKSIYTGGGETNESPISWYDIKPYAITVTGAKTADGETFYTTFFNAENSYEVADEETKIYIAKVNDSGKWIDLTQVDVAPAGNAVIIESAAASFTLNGSTTNGTFGTNNDLKGTATDKAVEAGSTYYVLSNGDAGVGFYQFAGETLAAGKAYIEVAGDAAAKVLPFGGTTAINGVADVKADDAVIYNLAGQRVNNAQKGVFVVGGKKVIF